MNDEQMGLGIFVGGQSRRMNGRPKGLLIVPETGESIVARLARIGNEMGFEVVLVGQSPAYAQSFPNIPMLSDSLPDIGPLGGLASLLFFAGDRMAIAVACALPCVSTE